MSERKAGRELDADIQRHVFGSTDIRTLRCFRSPEDGSVMPASLDFPSSFDVQEVCYLPKYEHDEKDDLFCVPVPPYSSDIAAAWQVHRKMCGRIFSVRQAYLHGIAHVIRNREGINVAWPDVLIFVEPADFCLAALAAMEAT